VALGGRATLAAVAARDEAKAAAFAARHGAARHYGSYAALLADPAIDAVYISLLNDQHRPWSIAASRAGKHVLCEKPAGLREAEVVEMQDAARAARRLWLEAYAYRCHPRMARVAELIAGGAIGAPRLAHSTFCFDGRALDRPRLWDPVFGGGALLDVGVYPLSLLRLLARFAGDGEPIAASAEGGVHGGVDHWCAGTLRFTSGFTTTFHTSMVSAAPSLATVHGGEGSIEIVDPWRCDTPDLILRRPGRDDERISLPDGEQRYGREALAVAAWCHQLEAPACPWSDSVGQARLLDGLRRQLGVRYPGDPW
jgi:predicted dehydrogenase